jgi:hypothetical protein
VKLSSKNVTARNSGWWRSLFRTCGRRDRSCVRELCRWAILVSSALCVTGCSTTIVAGARGNIFDASTGLPVQDARVTRPRVSGGYLIPKGGLPASTVVSDRHGHFDLPPYRHTVFTLVSKLKPHGADGHFEIAADGYEARIISGRATSQTSWRIKAEKILLKKP